MVMKKNPYSDKDPLRKIRPNTCVWLTVSAPRDMEQKGDIRKSVVLDRMGERIAVEQPENPLARDMLNSVISLSWLELGESGHIRRRMLDAHLVQIAPFATRDRKTTALWFDDPVRIYYGTLRRGFRVAVPEQARAFLQALDVVGRDMGLESGYRLVDISRNGVRFACKKFAQSPHGSRLDPVAELEVDDSLRCVIAVGGKVLLRADAIVRTKLLRGSSLDEEVHLGLEFLSYIPIGGSDEEAEPFAEKHSRVIAVYMDRFLRMSRSRDTGI
ncbi:MAG: hypothetical protein QMD09_11330 [Desulfatibacillaceae bacterium]|nr:hypothetical protein [Desulfatibacillaceae bacterium]